MTDRQCHTVTEEKCATVNEKQCTTVAEQQCETQYKQEQIRKLTFIRKYNVLFLNPLSRIDTGYLKKEPFSYAEQTVYNCSSLQQNVQCTYSSF